MPSPITPCGTTVFALSLDVQQHPAQALFRDAKQPAPLLTANEMRVLLAYRLMDPRTKDEPVVLAEYGTHVYPANRAANPRLAAGGAA